MKETPVIDMLKIAMKKMEEHMTALSTFIEPGRVPGVETLCRFIVEIYKKIVSTAELAAGALEGLKSAHAVAMELSGLVPPLHTKGPGQWKATLQKHPPGLGSSLVLNDVASGKEIVLRIDDENRFYAGVFRDCPEGDALLLLSFTMILGDKGWSLDITDGEEDFRAWICGKDEIPWTSSPSLDDGKCSFFPTLAGADFKSLTTIAAREKAIPVRTFPARTTVPVEPTADLPRTLTKEEKPHSFCSRCGSSLAKDACFCYKCGAKIVLFCTGCGDQLGENARFCARCGAPVT
jgi:hypothetical protein